MRGKALWNAPALRDPEGLEVATSTLRECEAVGSVGREVFREGKDEVGTEG